MISLLVATHVIQLTLGLCFDEATISCTLPNCTRARKTCEGGIWGPCECLAGPASCDDGNNCTDNVWNGTSCVYPPVAAQTLCRAATGPCDVAEYCSNGSCPPDGFAPPSQICRAEAGPCDAPEMCTGWSASCPGDAMRPSSYLCRAAAGRAT